MSKIKAKSIICFFSFAICILTFAFLPGCQNKQLYKNNRILMGTFIEVTSLDRRACGIVFQEFQRVENLFSKYGSKSQVAKLNATGKLKVSPEVFYVIKKSVEFWRLTDGAFDITAGILADLWGFSGKKYRVPREGEIENSMPLVGSDKIILNEKDNVVEFKKPGMKIDLGGIAKGYALDCAAGRLKEANIKSCLINAGGQVYALGAKFGKPWKVAIKNPQGQDYIGYLELKDRSVSTSGDYEQYFIKDGKKYTHIFDPKTGYPANSGIASVTVIAPDGLTADALSTAIFVLGKTKGKLIAGKFLNTEIRIIEQ